MSRLETINDFGPQPICNQCRHFIDGLKCKAFDTIPDEILFGENDHSKPLKGQKNKIVFEPIQKN